MSGRRWSVCRGRAAGAVLASVIVSVLALAPGAAAETISVNTTSDAVDDLDGLCSVREAVTSANSNEADANDCTDGESTEQDVIALDATGTYLLTGTGDEDANAAGDLDVHTDVTGVRFVGDLDGFGHPADLIDADDTDRVLDVHGGTDVTVDGVELTNGTSADDGGVIRAAGAGDLSIVGGSRIVDGQVEGNGGGIAKGDGGSLTIDDSEIGGNQTIDDDASGSTGGGIWTQAPLTMSRSLVTGNRVGADIGDSALDFETGGGIALQGDAEGTVITDSTIDNNEASAAEAADQSFGGAISIGVTPGGAVEIRGSTLHNNSVSTAATRNGSGIGLSTGDLRVVNSTLSAGTGSTGGGNALHVSQAIASATLDHVTVTGNGGAPAVPLFHNGPLTLRGSVIDQTGTACSGLAALTANAHNVDRGTSCVGSDPDTDLPNTNAMLAPPAIPNAFPPAVWIPPATSPAVDVEPVAACEEPDGAAPLVVDQRGVDRPVGDACDAGSVEVALCNGLEPTQLGGPAPELFMGTPGSDVIYASGGDDTIAGEESNDALCGGRGDDEITGGPGNEVIFGGLGDDTLLTQDGEADALDCGGGNDSYSFDSGVDSLLACETDLDFEPPEPPEPQPNPPAPKKKKCKKPKKKKKRAAAGAAAKKKKKCKKKKRRR
jgi:hypothetical protein